MRAGALAALLACLLLTACGQSEKPTAVLPAPTAPTTIAGASTTTTRPRATTTVPRPPAATFVAQANGSSVGIYPSPTAAAPTQVLPNPWTVDPTHPAAKAPQVFLVADNTPVDGRVEVLLPVRPNGSTGWIRAQDVTLTRVDYHVVVDLDLHLITVRKGAALVYTGRVAVGARATPTPTGHYYIRVLIRAVNPHTVYGPFAYGLSSHSNALSSFDGGDAEIGIHGNDDASVLGRNVTHGCVRMDNAEITVLAQMLPLGTPVDIVAPRGQPTP